MEEQGRHHVSSGNVYHMLGCESKHLGYQKVLKKVGASTRSESSLRRARTAPSSKTPSLEAPCVVTNHSLASGYQHEEQVEKKPASYYLGQDLREGLRSKSDTTVALTESCFHLLKSGKRAI